MSAPKVLRQHGRTVTPSAVHPIVAAIRDRQTFRSGALTARADINGTGRLAPEHLAALGQDEPTYIVYSYATPIAWWGRRGWVIPNDSYSMTTTRHQRFVHEAVS